MINEILKERLENSKLCKIVEKIKEKEYEVYQYSGLREKGGTYPESGFVIETDGQIELINEHRKVEGGYEVNNSKKIKIKNPNWIFKRRYWGDKKETSVIIRQGYLLIASLKDLIRLGATIGYPFVADAYLYTQFSGSCPIAQDMGFKNGWHDRHSFTEGKEYILVLEMKDGEIKFFEFSATRSCSVMRPPAEILLSSYKEVYIIPV